MAIIRLDDGDLIPEEARGTSAGVRDQRLGLG
jgi:hypothetical protein